MTTICHREVTMLLDLEKLDLIGQALGQPQRTTEKDDVVYYEGSIHPR